MKVKLKLTYYLVLTGLEFCDGGVICGEAGLAAIHIELGWVLSCPAHDLEPSSHPAINLTNTRVLKCQVTKRPDLGSGGWGVWG